MNSDAPISPELSVVFVLEKRHLQKSLALRLLDQFPDAEVFVDLSHDQTPSGVTGLLVQLERFLFRYPGRLPAPLTIKPLPDDVPIADVIVDLRLNGPDKKLCAHARLGLWWLHEFDLTGLVRGNSSLTVSLIGQPAMQEDAGLISEVCVQSKVLVHRTREFAMEKALQLIRRELARLKLTREFVHLGPIPDPPAPIRIGDFLGYANKVVSRLFLEVGNKVFAGFKPEPVFALRTGDGEADGFSPESGKNILHPHQGWYADPFLIEHGDALFCFFENLPPGAEQASISFAQVSDNQLDLRGTALKADYHLSFPFVFEHNGEFYLLPETIGSDRIEIWKATEFPTSWVLHATALDGQKFADPVLVEIADEWWLFASPSNDCLGDFSSELWLFRVDGPDLRSLEPHPLNPVVVGSDTARGGGRVMYHKERLLRFSQDNSGDIYGYGLNIMEITKITATDYEERRIRHICSDDIPGARGCHHIDFLDGHFVMDVRLP